MKLILATTLLFCSLLVNAQHLILSQPINKNSKLEHCFVIKSKIDTAQAALIAVKAATIMAANSLEIHYTPQLGELSDVVVTMPQMGVLKLGSHQINYRNSDHAAKKVAGILSKMFYSHGRPTYSTAFEWGKQGYDAYRIPSIVALPDGNVVAFIEARVNAKADQAENDIIAKISKDQGKTWSSPIMVAQAGQASLNNPCAVYVKEENKIILMYQYYPAKSNEGSTAKGYEGDNISRVFTTASYDGGESWSQPQDITRQAKHPEANSVCSGPGVAIRLTEGINKGRIVVPFNANGSTRWFNYLLYSDDRGESWKIAQGESGYGTNESQVVEIDEGELLVNARSHRYPESNGYTAPKGWSPWNFEKVTRNRANIRVTMNGDSTHWANPQVQPNLPDPTCQGSIIRVGKVLLLSNPASQHTVPIDGKTYAQTPPMRINGTVKASYDWGKTWTNSKRIYGDRLTEFQYSVLVDLGGGKIGCLFEVYPEVKFAVFDLKWVSFER